LFYKYTNKTAKTANSSKNTIPIPAHANTVFFPLSANIPKITDNIPAIAATGTNIITAAINSHHTALPIFPEGSAAEAMKQKRNTASKIAIGAAAKTKLAIEKNSFLLFAICLPPLLYIIT